MSSALAMAGVSAVLQYYLTNLYTPLTALFGGTVKVSAKAPDIVQEAFTAGSPENQVNLFLHQVTHNVGWRNQDQPSVGPDGMTRLSNPPLALDLHYLLTAYGSEDWQAEALLGFALLMLHENPVPHASRHQPRHRPVADQRSRQPALDTIGCRRPCRPDRDAEDHAFDARPRGNGVAVDSVEG